MTNFLVIVFLVIAFVFIFLYYNERKGVVPIRIGRRGSSVFSLETPYESEEETFRALIRELKDVSEYKFFMVCSGKSSMSPNTNISDKDYFVGALPLEEIEKISPGGDFKDISIFMLNEEVEEKDKLVLTHDLIVNSAQIPDREILLESGFIITAIKSSNLIIVTGVKGTFASALFSVFDIISQKGRRLLVSKM